MVETQDFESFLSGRASGFVSFGEVADRELALDAQEGKSPGGSGKARGFADGAQVKPSASGVLDVATRVLFYAS